MYQITWESFNVLITNDNPEVFTRTAKCFFLSRCVRHSLVMYCSFIFFSSCCYSSRKYLPWPLARLPDGYTFFSVSQERIMDEIDEEAKRARLQGPKTGANWGACVARLLSDCVSVLHLTEEGLLWTLVPLMYIPWLVAVRMSEQRWTFFFLLDCEG